jgi:hypothetical protein
MSINREELMLVRNHIQLFCMFIIISYNILSQVHDKPIVVSPVIGDTLSLSLRNRYNLFPTITGFHHAVFYLNPDSSLKVKITIRENNLERDTIIERYYSPGLLRSHIETINENAKMKITNKNTTSIRVFLKNGSIIQGVIINRSIDTLQVDANYLGKISIPVGQIEKVEGGELKETGLQYAALLDPNQTRAFLMPTANTVPAGKGYIGDYELVFFTAAIGVTDWLMLNAGFLLLPIPLEDQIINYGLKARLFQSTNKISIAVGIQMLKVPNSENIPGIGYGVISFGNENSKLNIAIGSTIGMDTGDNSAVFGASGDVRVSESVKFLAEMWIIPKADFIPLVLGVRFFGSKLSGDIGLLYPIGEKIPSPIGIPVLNLIYNF